MLQLMIGILIGGVVGFLSFVICAGGTSDREDEISGREEGDRGDHK